MKKAITILITVIVIMALTACSASKEKEKSIFERIRCRITIPVCKALYNNIPSLFGASAPDEGGILLPESEFIT
ncbi:MAG: hypothetical protein IJV14_10370 [Lachnospiraceae bacterium]|nr:hypothetical protein [Lachnospiraceae bacterium]